ncbi:MAG: hypothetical protein H6Q10_3671 [Acidobacteria bacterium]|nr:hypothetical protein [Acidobacteriota bacterium]
MRPPQIGTRISSAPFAASLLAGSGNEVSWQIIRPTFPKSVSNTGKSRPGASPCATSSCGSCAFRYVPTMRPARSISTPVLKMSGPTRSSMLKAT